MKAFRFILDIVFPTRCLSCNKRGEDYCLACFYSAPPNPRENPEWIYPLFDYRHPPIRKAIWMMKYKNKRKFAELFANILYEHITEELSELYITRNFREPILIPVPLSKKRKRERGFNQSQIIARQIFKLDQENNKTNNLELEENILTKTRETEHQARIKSRRARLENLSGTFGVLNPEKISGRNIILIDDVLTTGATLSEARKTLKKAGAKKIIAFTIAH